MSKKLIYLTSLLLVLSTAGEGWSKASNPAPFDGTILEATWASLSWQAGENDVSFDIYIGTNYDDVRNGTGGTFQGNQTLPFIVVGFSGFPYSDGLVPGTTYYWRIDEINNQYRDSPWAGDVWSFTVGATAPPDVAGRTIYVDAVNGNDNNNGSMLQTALATIQNGIDEATNGDVVLVHPGLYLEEINFLGKAITVQGVAVSPAGVPVLWNPGDFTVSFYYGEGPGSILKNFIIKDSFMGIFIADSSPTISNLTIVGNKYGIEAYADSQPDISNIILWDNTDGDLFGCRARYSCVERGGEGNITDDPLFVDPDNGDYHIRSARGRYWPRFDIWVLDKVTSPCVDAGDPYTGALNEPMPNGGRINIGAYGGTTEASLSPSEQNLPGQAYNPSPPDEADDVVVYDIILSWTHGAYAVSHDVYFGTNDSLDFMGNQTTTEFDPGMLDPGTTYYWRIDEVNFNGKRTGAIWKFTTSDRWPPKGRACFLPETLVLAESKLVEIQNVTASRTIDSVQEHEGTYVCRDIVLETGNTISVVDAHCFMTDSGQWVAAQNLTTRLRLKTLTGTVGIKSITTRNYTGKVYNLKIRNSDQYLVGKDSVIVRDY